jgi:LuxR family transcriptional regulator, maltose regulon positive regulatory protein
MFEPAAATLPLLKSKYTLPPLRPNLVARPRLIARLNANQHCRLVLISAPAGFGKTTLLAEWQAGQEGAGTVAWLGLDEADNDPAQFLQYLIAALQQVDEKIGRTVLQLLAAPQGRPMPALLAPLVGDMAAAGHGFYLVLDDYHAINAPAVHEILQFLVEYLPPSSHLVIATREDPPLPLPRLRARGQVVELRERDLRFTMEEAAAFLNKTMALALARPAVAALQARTEGWIAGLQLAALALQESAESPEDAGRLAQEFTGQDRYVIDYLLSEVLEHQPEPVRSFLVQTAILDRLSAGLCDAVTGRNDGQAVLARLEQSNLFLMPLDHQRMWYRYYRLFAEFLRTRLEPADAAVLHGRAAAWYESQGLAGEAVRHALARAQVTGDWPAAVRLICATAEEQIEIGAATTLQSWLAPVPDAYIRGDAELALIRAWASVMTGDFPAAERYAAAAEAAPGKAAPAVTGKLLTLAAILAMGRQEHETVIDLAQRGLALLSEDETRWRTLALWELAEAQERTRPIDEALASLRQIQAGRKGPDRRGRRSQFFGPAIDGFLAAALNNSGRRCEALAACEQSLAEQSDEAGGLGPLASMVLAQQALIHWEGQELSDARASAEAARTQAELLGFPDVIVFALGSLAFVTHAEGHPAEALRLIRLARGLTEGESFSDTSWLRAYQAHIQLQSGDRDGALRWAEAESLTPASEPAYLNTDALLVYARLLLALNRLPEARGLLARLAAFVAERGLRRYEITVHLLQALAAEASGELSAAKDQVLRGLKIAVPEGYLRRFLEEDRRLRGLVAPIRYAAPDFIDRLLQEGANISADVQAGAEGSRPDAAHAAPPAAQPLIEPLTERELEILRLLAAGMANAEIAARLIIATGTVKRHLNNIYGKLGVESRTQAIARGKELGLL